MTSAKFHAGLKSLLARHDETKIIVNLGSGPIVLQNRKDIINIDIFAFNEVDIVADGIDLPIKDHSVDVIFNTAMLEHVANPERRSLTLLRTYSLFEVWYSYVRFVFVKLNNVRQHIVFLIILQFV